jgi:predicted alpha/beta superfamily hydrolase
VDSSYRTDEERLIAGYSVAGNYVLYTFFEGSAYFSRYLSGSPYGLYLFYNKHLYNLPDSFPASQRVYTSMGNKDKEDQFGPFVDFCKELEQMAVKELDFRYDTLDGRDHNSAILPNWYDGLAFLYKDWSAGE